MWIGRTLTFNSTWGRFVNVDPHMASAMTPVPVSWNRYAYTHNDSVNFYDPSGLALVTVYEQYGNWTVPLVEVPFEVPFDEETGAIGGESGTSTVLVTWLPDFSSGIDWSDVQLSANYLTSDQVDAYIAGEAENPQLDQIENVVDAPTEPTEHMEGPSRWEYPQAFKTIEIKNGPGPLLGRNTCFIISNAPLYLTFVGLGAPAISPVLAGVGILLTITYAMACWTK
jgi:hypothetical protein